jgi:hypothetical protein
MPRLSQWLVGILLVMVAGILGFMAAVHGGNLPLLPPEDVMIETLEWVIPEGEVPPALLIEAGGRTSLESPILL